MTLSQSSITLAGQVVIMQSPSPKARTSVSASRSTMLVAIQAGSVAVSLNRILLAVPNKARLVAGYEPFPKQSSGPSSHQEVWIMQCAQLLHAPAGCRGSR